MAIHKQHRQSVNSYQDSCAKFWKFNLIIILILGLFFRFTNLNKKVYWFDETYTSLRVSGFTQEEVVKTLYDGSVIKVNDLLTYQQFSPNKSYWGTINGLAKEEPQHVPLYFILARFWSQLFGSSIAVQRSFAVVMSLPLLPLIYWLCRLLFSSLVAEMGLVLIAISPFFVLHAQENRPYSLWGTTILLSSITLLKAIKSLNILWWISYAISLTLGFYSFMFTGLVVFGHAIYVGLTERLRFSRVTLSFLGAFFFSLLAFLPWVAIVLNNLERVQETVAKSEGTFSFLPVVKSFIGRIGYVFIDINPNHTYVQATTFKLNILKYLQYLGGFVIILLLIYGCYFIYFNAPKKSVLFVFTLLVGNLLPLIMLDLIIGGGKVRTITNRYLIPTFLSLEILMAYLLAKITWQPINTTKNQTFFISNQLGKIITALVISVGIISCAMSSQAVMWWNKGANYYIPAMAQIINQSEKPLVITDDRTNNKPLRNVLGDIFSLSHELEDKTYLQLLIAPQIPQIPKSFNDVFLFKPSSNLRQGLEAQQYSLELVYGSENTAISLWKVTTEN